MITLNDRFFDTISASIAVGDLGAEKTGSDETQCRDEGKNNDVLATGPVKRIMKPHQFDEAEKGPSSDEEKEGD